MIDDQRERRGPFVGCLAIGMLLGLPAYVLSIGPAVWLHQRGYFPEWAIAFYWPIGVLVAIFPAVERVFRWYENLWQ
jgi:hypothetical protein